MLQIGLLLEPNDTMERSCLAGDAGERLSLLSHTWFKQGPSSQTNLYQREGKRGGI